MEGGGDPTGMCSLVPGSLQEEIEKCQGQAAGLWRSTRKKKKFSLLPLPFVGPITGLSLAKGKGQGSDLVLNSYL